MLGQTLTGILWDKAGEALLAEVHFRTSPHRATLEYRRHLAGIVLRRVVAQAYERANRTEAE
jgi:CO/xanthine dehydrogenase FAD-binding subunit